MDTVITLQDPVIGCNPLQGTGGNFVDLRAVPCWCGLHWSNPPSLSQHSQICHGEDALWQLSSAVVRAFLFIFDIAYNGTFNNISLVYKKPRYSWNISLYLLTKQLILCWSSPIQLKVCYYCVSGCARVKKSEESSMHSVIYFLLYMGSSEDQTQMFMARASLGYALWWKDL